MKIFKRKPRVFILNYDGHDFEPAREYGDELINITEGRQNIFSTDRLKYNIKKTLIKKKYNPEVDFLIPSGSPVVAFIMGLVCRELYNNQDVRLLIWNAKDRRYHLRDIVNIKPKVRGDVL